MRRLIIPALLLFALSACNVREMSSDLPQATFTATQELAESKTQLSDRQVFWSENDAISVFSASVPGGERYAMDPECAGSRNARFTGNYVGAAPYYAMYPADAAASLEGTVLSIALPASQQYAEGSFASGFNPMVAVTSGSSFSFRNLCALLSVSLSGDATVTSVSITSNKAEALWGTATVDMGYTEVPAMVMTAPADDAHRTLTMDCGSGVALGTTPVDFYFVVPAGSFSEGFTLSVTDSRQGSMTKVTTNPVSTTRSILSHMAALPYLQTDSPFLNQSVYGVYAIDEGTPTPVKTYVKGTDQLALRSHLDIQTFRIQSLVTKSALLVSSQPDMEIGGTYSLSLQSVGNTGVSEGTVTATLLKSEGGKLWLQETSGNRGFIIAGAL